jgi:cyclopropane fatty-acyl-phospholipid synthase-like methyltransferase
MTVPTNWYEDFFQGLSLDLWRKAISPKQTKSEADFLVKVLNCNEGSHLLDVPCGNGRLSLALAQRGFRVTGVDISEEFVEEARAACALEPPTNAGGTDLMKRAYFILGDMSRIEGEAIYDGGSRVG